MTLKRRLQRLPYKRWDRGIFFRKFEILKMLRALFFAFSADLTRAVEQDFYSQDKEVNFPSLTIFSSIILKAKIKWSSAHCDPTEILILPSNGKQWLCNKPFTPTAVDRNTRCILTCDYGFGVVQGK